MLHVLLAAFFAGAVAICVTVAIEKLGGVTGGFIATLPSTIVPASLGVAAASSHEIFVAAMAAVPVGMLANASFLYLWRVLPPQLPAWSLPRRLGLMMALTLSAWGAMAGCSVWLIHTAAALGAPVAALGLIASALILVMGVVACWRSRPAPRGARRVGPLVLGARGLLAALAIALSVTLARSGGGLASGLAAVFPAIFLTTMVSLWLAQGEAVPTGAVGPMMLGSASVGAYSLLCTITFPRFGPAAGAAIAWSAAVLTITAPSWLWLRSR